MTLHLANIEQPGNKISQLKTNGDFSSTQNLPHSVTGLAEYQWIELYGYHLLFACLGLSLLVGTIVIFLLRRKPKYTKTSEIELLPQLVNKIQQYSPKEPFHDPYKTNYFFELNMLLLAILEELFKFPATDLTLRELINPIKSHFGKMHLDPSNIMKILERCEEIKFAQSQTNLKEAQSIHHSTCEIVSKIKTCLEAIEHKVPSN